MREHAWEVCRCERDLDMDLERPRVLLSAVHVTVRRCLCDIVMLSEGVPGAFTLCPNTCPTNLIIEKELHPHTADGSRFLPSAGSHNHQIFHPSTSTV